MSDYILDFIGDNIDDVAEVVIAFIAWCKSKGYPMDETSFEMFIEEVK